MTPSSEALRRRMVAATLFTPSAPVKDIDLLQGRVEELQTLVDACFAAGRHAVLFGERGVGKTSLANVFVAILRSQSGDLIAGRETCESSDTYSRVMGRMLGRTRVLLEAGSRVGFLGDKAEQRLSIAELVGPEAAPSDLWPVVEDLGLSLVLVVDEFDRLVAEERRRFADALKIFSDNSAPITLILVGVADSVTELVEDHGSVGRALAQIRVPRMTFEEAKAVLTTRLDKLEIARREDLVESIAHMSQGMPHFVHLMGLGTVITLIERGGRRLEPEDLRGGIRYAVKQADQHILRLYMDATKSPRTDALFTKVLCACAMAETDEEGFFTSRQVLPHMKRLHGSQVTIATFSKHLDLFSSADRGRVLQKAGTRRKYRFRFTHPMMTAYVLIKAVYDGSIDGSDVRYAPAHTFL